MIMKVPLYFATGIIGAVALVETAAQPMPGSFINKYPSYEIGYEFSNFMDGGYQLIHFGYCEFFRRDAEGYRIKKFTAIAPAGNILVVFKDRITHFGGRLGIMFAFHYFNKKNSGDFPLTMDLSYSYLNKNDSRLNFAVGTSSAPLKATVGINYLFNSEGSNSRFFPEVGIKVQISSYHRAFW